MKTTTIVILFCLALAANASWIENLANSSWYSHIMNHTKLRGKLNLTTNNGFKLDYNANLGYKDDMLALDLANVGARLNIVRQNSTNLSDGDFNRTYNYTGDLVVNHNGHKANVNVDGVAQFAGTMNKTGNASGNATFEINNKNTYNASAGDFQAVGGHFSFFKLFGQSHKNGSHINTVHHIKGAAGGSTNFTKNGTQIGSGFFVKGGKAKVFNHVYLTEGKVEEIDYEGHHAKPDAVSNGKAYYKGFTNFGWNNETQGYSKHGKAGFEGVYWTHSNDTDNTTFNGFAGAKNIDFTQQGQIWANGKKVADTMSVGDIALLKSGGVKISQDGSWSKGFGSTGVFNKWTIGKLAGHHEESKSVAESDDEESEEFNIDCILKKFSSNKTLEEKCKKRNKTDDHHHKGEFLAKFKANWAHRTELNGTKGDDNGANINFNSGTLYKLGGHDSLSNKHWKHQGYKTVSGEYTVDGEGKNPGNLTINF